MHGRLGNQLFQYAFARKLQLTTNQDICCGFKKVNSHGAEKEGWNNDLQYFNVVNFTIDNEKNSILITKTTLSQKIWAGLYFFSYALFRSSKTMDIRRYIQLKWQKLLNKKGLFWLVQGYCEPTIPRHENIILNGHFEDIRYFDDIKNRLIEEFTPKYPSLEKNKELLSIICNTNSVCVSVRRGDYETNNANKKIFSVCDKDYFLNAIKYMQERLYNPIFIFFSDDIDWVKSNLQIKGMSYYEDGTDPVWEKLRLMYSCKHYIISNSTFSWWAQYLSRNKRKIVVSPDVWFKTSAYSDLILDTFYTIKTKD
jgi:hypothetical protein